MNTQKQLSAFKKEVCKTRIFLASLMVIWQNPNHDLLALLLQNLSFDGSCAINHSFEADFKRCAFIIQTINELKERTPQCPVTQYICEEIDLLYTGYVIMANI